MCPHLLHCHSTHASLDLTLKTSEMVIIGTNKIYLDVSKPINCSGAITSWQYCHFIIGFRNASSGLWPCVWRQSNDSEASSYENVGCNKFTVVPGDGDNFRCQYFIPSNPADVIEVKEGDYIGFYVPDSGLLPALSQVDDNAGDDQLLRVRNVTGFTSYLKDSELRNCQSTIGQRSFESRNRYVLIKTQHMWIP